MIRPKLNVGDIVKLSKKGRAFVRDFPLDSSFVVSKITGDGSEKRSIILCRLETEDGYVYKHFYRSEIWFTGKNAFR